MASSLTLKTITAQAYFFLQHSVLWAIFPMPQHHGAKAPEPVSFTTNQADEGHVDLSLKHEEEALRHAHKKRSDLDYQPVHEAAELVHKPFE